MMGVPQAAPARRIGRFRAEIDAALDRVVGGDRYILGPAVEAFEAEFAAYLGVAHCIGVGTGTDAVTLALRALEVGPGDEVITVSLTAAGTAQAILLCGAELRFVDVDRITRCMDPNAVEAAITPRTAAIVPVHLFGQPADILRLVSIADRHGLAVVEDCAQAHGAAIGARKVGSFGHAGAFSFYPTKNLGGIGDGGAVVCRDAATAARVRSLRCYGWDDETHISRRLAGNSRLDEVQAAILSALLVHLDEGNDERRALAAEYRRRLHGLGLGMPPDGPGSVYHQFAVACDSREALRRNLWDHAGIGTAVHYFPALHRQPAFHVAGVSRLPNTEALAESLLSLPIQPEVAGPNLARIAEAVRTEVGRCKRS
jgi:dTDP-3-amino-3,4,6-trideoxy-alpha-D-glucose transaminase